MINEVITLAEVAKKYNLDISNLRKRLKLKIDKGVLQVGFDVRLAGNTWLINKNAVRKLLK